MDLTIVRIMHQRTIHPLWGLQYQILREEMGRQPFQEKHSHEYVVGAMSATRADPSRSQHIAAHIKKKNPI